MSISSIPAGVNLSNPSLEQSPSPENIYTYNNTQDNVNKYSKFEVSGTSGLPIWRLETLFEQYVTKNQISVKEIKALDFGCGTGRTRRWAERVLGLNPAAVDISPEMIDKARELDPSNANSYQLIENGAIPAPNDTYDCIFCIYVLLVIPTVPEMDKVLTEMHRVLKPKGIVWLVTSNEHTHSNERNWVTWFTQYAGNTNLFDGKPALLRNKATGAEFLDLNWLASTYLPAFQRAGFECLERIDPLAQKNERDTEWKDELSYAPSSIYVLEKKPLQ
jgi:ubiquinone/menaquinone biosynthesis C-methylase UbiE